MEKAEKAKEPDTKTCKTPVPVLVPAK